PVTPILPLKAAGGAGSDGADESSAARGRAVTNPPATKAINHRIVRMAGAPQCCSAFEPSGPDATKSETRTSLPIGGRCRSVVFMGMFSGGETIERDLANQRVSGPTPSKSDAKVTVKSGVDAVHTINKKNAARPMACGKTSRGPVAAVSGS